LPAPGKIGFTGEARPALRGLRSRRCQHLLYSEILLHGFLNERAANPTLLQFPLQALRAVAAVGETRGEIGVRIGRIVEGTAGVETRHDLVHDLGLHTTPVELLPDLVSRARAGAQVLQRCCLGRQELLSGPEALLVCYAQPVPYPQPPLSYDLLGDAEGKRPVQED
jgi:hypothetical protein